MNTIEVRGKIALLQENNQQTYRKDIYIVHFARVLNHNYSTFVPKIKEFYLRISSSKPCNYNYI